MLRTLRIGVAVAVFTLLTAWFLDFAGLVPEPVGWLAKIQFSSLLLGKQLPLLIGLLLLTLLFGRFYCSTICPLGILQDIFIRVRQWVRPKSKRNPPRFTFRSGKIWLRWVMGLTLLLGMVPKMGVLRNLVDPYSAFGRVTVQLLRPVYIAVNNLCAVIGTHFENYTFYYVKIAGVTVASLIVSGATLLLVGWMATRYGRLYCNTLCPVGALLGGISRLAIFRPRIDADRCTSCGLCEGRCKSECIDSQAKTIETSRCVDCFNCLGACNRGAIHFDAVRPRKPASSVEAVESQVEKNITERQEVTGNGTPPVSHGDHRNASPNRREILAWAAGVGGVTCAAGAMRPVDSTNKVASADSEKPANSDVSAKKTTDADGTTIYMTGRTPYPPAPPISPPGAMATARLQHHCTACHLCISRCPSYVLRPARLEYGLAGFLHPVMDFTLGYCNQECVECGRVCPTQAIRLLPVEEKRLTQVGRVEFLRENCVVPVDGTSCGACAEHCPTQAVRMVPYRDGLTIPEIDPDLCIGCGACEFICPVRPYRAIHVRGIDIHATANELPDEAPVAPPPDDFGF